MAKPNKVQQSEEYIAMRSAANELNEDNDCSVKALALVCEITYQEAHALLAAEGRKSRNGTPFAYTRAALESIGFKAILINKNDIICQYPGIHSTALKGITSYHPARFPDVWKNGKKYLMATRGHILAVIDGKTHDWSAGRALCCTVLYEIVKA